MRNTKYLPHYVEDEQTAILDRVGMFFAFGNQQFEEGLQKLRDDGKLLPGEKLASIGGGAYLPSKNVDDYRESVDTLWERGALELKQKYGRAELVAYELDNHEARYTGSTEDTLSSVAIYYTDDEIKSGFMAQDVHNILYRCVKLYGWI